MQRPNISLVAACAVALLAGCETTDLKIGRTAATGSADGAMGRTTGNAPRTDRNNRQVQVGRAEAATAQTRRAPRPLDFVVAMRGAEAGDSAWPLTESQNKMASINFPEKLTAPSLNCVYRKPGGTSPVHRLSFWQSNQPDLSRMNGPMPVDLDVAVATCPTTWGEAVALGWGLVPGRWRRLRKKPTRRSGTPTEPRSKGSRSRPRSLGHRIGWRVKRRCRRPQMPKTAHWPARSMPRSPRWKPTWDR